MTSADGINLPKNDSYTTTSAITQSERYRNLSLGSVVDTDLSSGPDTTFWNPISSKEDVRLLPLLDVNDENNDEINENGDIGVDNSELFDMSYLKNPINTPEGGASMSPNDEDDDREEVDRRRSTVSRTGGVGGVDTSKINSRRNTNNQSVKGTNPARVGGFSSTTAANNNNIQSTKPPFNSISGTETGVGDDSVYNGLDSAHRRANEIVCARMCADEEYFILFLKQAIEAQALVEHYAYTYGLTDGWG